MNTGYNCGFNAKKLHLINAWKKTNKFFLNCNNT